VAEQYDENGVDYDRAGESGYARVTFSVVRADTSSQLLSTEHPLYLDRQLTVPAAGGPAYAHVPEDRGELGYRIEANPGDASLEIVDLATPAADGSPTELYRMSCRAGSVNGSAGTTFDSPNRGEDGSFVRIEVVDIRSALCGSGTLR
jgi:hypothetical protein